MTPVVLDDWRHRNGTAVQQPYILHAQWHKISAMADEKPESIALIVVYRYDVYYVPWSSKPAVANSFDTDKRNVTTDTRTVDMVKIPRTPSTTTPPAVDDDDNNDGNGKEQTYNETTSAKLSWEPWPHSVVRRITTTGSDASVSNVGEVINGVTDYLYESKQDGKIEIKKKRNNKLYTYAKI